MGIYFSWIKEELIKYFPQDNPAAGFDLNQNNQLEENERIGDLNQDQFVDEKDWMVYFENNKTTLRNLGGIFQWSEGLSLDNPIQSL